MSDTARQLNDTAHHRSPFEAEIAYKQRYIETSFVDRMSSSMVVRTQRIDEESLRPLLVHEACIKLHVSSATERPVQIITRTYYNQYITIQTSFMSSTYKCEETVIALIQVIDNH